MPYKMYLVGINDSIFSYLLPWGGLRLNRHGLKTVLVNDLLSLPCKAAVRNADGGEEVIYYCRSRLTDSH